MYGYIIERQGVSWNERFYRSGWKSNGFSFGGDETARIFVSKEAAEAVSEQLEREEGIYAVVRARSDFYPPPV